MALRLEVFCGEQGVPVALERDEHDATALHLVALDPAGGVVGTCRLLDGGEEWRLGRMAVARPARGRGVGRAMLAAAHDQARARGGRAVVLHAQTHAIPFYAAAGYVARGPEFMDAGIPHREMRIELSHGPSTCT